MNSFLGPQSSCYYSPVLRREIHVRHLQIQIVSQGVVCVDGDALVSFALSGLVRINKQA